MRQVKIAFFRKNQSRETSYNSKTVNFLPAFYCFKRFHVKKYILGPIFKKKFQAEKLILGEIRRPVEHLGYMACRTFRVYG